MEKQYLLSCAQCDQHFLSTKADAKFCGRRCTKRARLVFDPARSRRRLVACVVCGVRFTQPAATGRLRLCCGLHFGGYRLCSRCGKRCRPRPGGKLCRACKNHETQPPAGLPCPVSNKK